MKTAYRLRGILSLTLLFAISFFGCENNTNGGGAKTYTVSFDGGDGSGAPPASQQVEENKSITLPGKGSLTAPAGKEFDGWRTGGVSYAVGDSYTVKADVTFIAQWKTTAVSYTVTFDADGGTPAQTTKTVTVSGGNVGALPADPTRVGYTFDNWHTAQNGGGTQFTAATPVTANITVYAKWTVVAQSYTVTFDADGGSPAQATKTVASSGGTVAALPSDPTKTGYTFDGWYPEKNGGGTQFTTATPVTADRTVYAKWKAENPFVGGIWLDLYRNLHYEFTDIPDDGGYVYNTAARDSAFYASGSYEINSERKEITLRPTGGNRTIKSYEITKSLLSLEKGKAEEAWYTRNPKTGGGFNGEPGPAPLGGMWQDVNDDNHCLGFNKDGECFGSILQNREGKIWWFVMGTYEYNTERKELTIRYNGLGTPDESIIFDVLFTNGNQILEITERRQGVMEEERYNKRGDI